MLFKSIRQEHTPAPSYENPLNSHLLCGFLQPQRNNPLCFVPCAHRRRHHQQRHTHTHTHSNGIRTLAANYCFRQVAIIARTPHLRQSVLASVLIAFRISRASFGYTILNNCVLPINDYRFKLATALNHIAKDNLHSPVKCGGHRCWSPAGHAPGPSRRPHRTA